MSGAGAGALCEWSWCTGSCGAPGEIVTGATRGTNNPTFDAFRGSVGAGAVAVDTYGADVGPSVGARAIGAIGTGAGVGAVCVKRGWLAVGCSSRFLSAVA